jgi:Ca2+-binding RTX toxin-like protein
MKKRTLIALAFLLAVAGAAMALVPHRPDSPLALKQFVAPEMEIVGALARPSELPESWRIPSLLAFESRGVGSMGGLLDPRSARWGTLYPAIPLIPGDGVGNTLTWRGLGAERPRNARAIADFTWKQLSQLLREHADSLRLDVDEISIRSGAFYDGELVQFSGRRVFRGIPVRTAALTAVVNHGNLSLMGAYAWGDIHVDLTPTLSADDAVVRVAEFVVPWTVAGLRASPSLTIVPTAVAAPDFEIGEGYEHRLAWVVAVDVSGAFGQWEALVDAHNGELLSFQDLNQYARNVNGGHYPITYDGIGPEGTMQDNYPMPFADVSSGGFTDAGGNFTAAGSVTTTLSGQYVLIDDQCAGVFMESSTGDIELGGTDGDVDCDTPTSGDNTASARSGFYEVNRIIELAQGQLPANTWLTSQLESNMNINNTCNAFWSPSAGTINFYREGDGCGNTGQIAGVFDHEWGHGMDDNDVNGNIISGSAGGGEGVSDLYAALRLDTSCIGRGFCMGSTESFCAQPGGMLCGGYGDPCTPASGCSGIRDIDWANRTSGLPHDLTWIQANCTHHHCYGAAYAEAVWDLFKRDLPTLYGLDNNTAMEVTSRLLYLAGGNLDGWYSVSGTPHDNCAANFSYLEFLAVDDDNGNLADGTPHMTAIATAFERLEIDCSPANGGPTVQDGGCAANPTEQPVVTVASGDTTANLTWNAVANASTYNVYRTDGLFGCDFGKALVGSTAGTSFADSGLKNDHPYFYTVIPMGAGGASCFGPASACAVPNDPPTVDPPVVIPEPSDEGEMVTASATFADTSDDSPYTCTVDYGAGDGPVSGTVAGMTCTGPPHAYGDNGTYTVTVAVTDSQGGTGSAASSHEVLNVAPTVEPPVVVPEPSNEGDAVIASAMFTDPGVDDSPFTCTVDYGDGVGPVPGIVSTMTCTGPSHYYADNGDYPVTIAVTDKDGDTGSASSSHHVDNVPPTITATTNSAAECGDTPEGDPVAVSADFSDPGYDNPVAGTVEDFTDSTIDWGDGNVEPAMVSEVPGGPGTLTTGTVSGSHVYATGGIFTITITVADDDGGTDAASLTAFVTGAGLNGGVLQVVGTNLKDVINIRRKQSDFEVMAGFLHPKKQRFPRADVIALEVAACDGKDQVIVKKSVPVPAVLDGGNGRDRVKAGSGLSLLVGGLGNDRLFAGDAGDTLDGGPGHDILQGGNGPDTLLGQNGNDHLFGHQGDDDLDGGAGVDLCQGGPGNDTIVNCEP